MSSTLVTPLLISQPFGFGASNPTYINIPIPVASQIGITVNAASFTDGFPPSTMTPEASGGLPFFGQDMNGILYMLSAYAANFAAGALPAYNATLVGNISGYPAGVVLVAASGSHLWLNLTNGNATNPDTGGANWLPIACTREFVLTLASGTYTLTAEQAAHSIIAFNGTLTGNCTVNFPANEGQSWIVAAYTAGAFNIVLQTVAAGNQVSLVSAGGGGGYSSAQNVFSDGLNLWSNNVSTAGLAPIASPAFTGTPTTPTAASSSNTTQIASTAMVQAAITAALAAYAPKASPILSGMPTAPTAAPGTNDAQLATTAFVEAAVAAAGAAQLIRTGSFACANGGTAIAFSPAFPTACASLQLTHASVANGANIGFAGYNSLSRTGAVCYASINGMTVNYVAIGS